MIEAFIVIGVISKVMNRRLTKKTKELILARKLNANEHSKVNT
jgi:hypothetical protein